jgi:phosphatidylglycerophosphatase C
LTPAGPDEPAPGSPGPTVAAFDFDGTLTWYDSLLPFLVSVRGVGATARAVIAEGPRFGRVLAGRTSRDEAKEALLIRLLRGVDAEQVSTTGQAYAQRLIRRLKPGMRRRLEWHRRLGHQVVIVSASPALYLEPTGRQLGADAVLATELDVGPDGRLTGKLLGPNCRGEEKATRLRAWLASAGGCHETPVATPPRQVWAYGDSRGDTEMLALADVAVWVGWRALISQRRGAAIRDRRRAETPR